jgi:hypothetical protein
MISQEVVSHFYVFRSPMKDWILGYAYGTGAITHGMHYPKNLGASTTYSVSMVDYAIEDYL